eukprot:CAMPEP_0180476594 /NCGR_PEP_ID=MMETSP1036_2-20121128/31820_1 /TAXON_ID=632150 /ORGANISM="Azadinium spinosum, Strain 3D9" /LENGTH=215 /DNA_ID=CAMNT_0022484041 /DNA_START=31 /DNA_END=678 /DNA_ORIENTATION=-
MSFSSSGLLAFTADCGPSNKIRRLELPTPDSSTLISTPQSAANLSDRLERLSVDTCAVAKNAWRFHVRLDRGHTTISEEVGEALLAVLVFELLQGGAVDTGDHVLEAQAGLTWLLVDCVDNHAPPTGVQVDAAAHLEVRTQGDLAGSLGLFLALPAEGESFWRLVLRRQRHIALLLADLFPYFLDVPLLALLALISRIAFEATAAAEREHHGICH